MSPESTTPPLRIVRRNERPTITVSPRDLCRFEPLNAERRLPWLVRPAMPEVDLAAWLRNNRQPIEQRLRDHGGLLFRGFHIGATERFEDCIKALSGSLLEYEYRSTPRTRVSGSIYTSTEYPSHRSIPLHNEMSYARAWPLKLWFYAVTPAASGGQTPIADSRRVLARLSPRVRDKFEARRVMYVRNYGHGVDLPWQEVFQTAERKDVERLCRNVGMEFDWKSDDRLTTRHVCQAVANHPATGDALWFNQAHLFHLTSLDAASQALLRDRFVESELPRHAYYGDGSAIEPEALDEIRDAFDREQVLFPWQAGDLLLLDNMLTAHGRRPYEGPRRLLAGMAERHGQVDTCVEM
jgi:alpha-ketoglutarate-dependent taurine dioxygenase